MIKIIIIKLKRFQEIVIDILITLINKLTVVLIGVIKKLKNVQYKEKTLLCEGLAKFKKLLLAVTPKKMLDLIIWIKLYITHNTVPKLNILLIGVFTIHFLGKVKIYCGG
jgi:hypothetical protein